MNHEDTVGNRCYNHKTDFPAVIDSKAPGINSIDAQVPARQEEDTNHIDDITKDFEHQVKPALDAFCQKGSLSQDTNYSFENTFRSPASHSASLAPASGVQDKFEDKELVVDMDIGIHNESEVIELIVKEGSDPHENTKYELVKGGNNLQGISADLALVENMKELESESREGFLKPGTDSCAASNKILLESLESCGDREEIVITVMDDMDLPFDETAENIALSCLNISGNEVYGVGPESGAVWNKNLSGLQYSFEEKRQETAHIIEHENIWGQVADEPTQGVSGVNDNFSGSFMDRRVNFVTDESCNVHEKGASCQTVFSPPCGEQDHHFDRELKSWGSTSSNLDQLVPHQLFLDRYEYRAEEKDKSLAHPILLDEHGDYDLDPIPYQTYSDKEGNIYSYNPKTGKFELEMLSAVENDGLPGTEDTETPIDRASHMIVTDQSKGNILEYGSISTNKPESNQKKGIEFLDYKQLERVSATEQLNEIMVRLPNDIEGRERMVQEMMKGAYGSCPSVVKITSDGTVKDITRWFKHFLPKKTGKPRSGLKKAQNNKSAVCINKT